jgi:hypothetical protein
MLLDTYDFRFQVSGFSVQVSALPLDPAAASLIEKGD